LFKIEYIKQQVQTWIQETVPKEEAPVKAIEEGTWSTHSDG